MDAASQRTTLSSSTHSLAAVILGNDAVVAARPRTPAQLANACTAAGFDLVVPPTWGDELVAAAYLEQLAGRDEHVVLACACPRVAALVARSRDVVVPQVAIASPPVAVARALRAVHGDTILITYVGDCPSATDASIDVRFTPAGLFAQLERQGISLAEQSAELPPDHSERYRRYASVAGGLPALRFLARAPVERVLRTVDGAALARGEIPGSRSKVVLDLADAAQCVCGGARDTIHEEEPARSSAPILQRPAALDMAAEPSSPRSRTIALRGPSRAMPVTPARVTDHRPNISDAVDAADTAPFAAAAETSTSTPVVGTVPRAVDAGPHADAETGLVPAPLLAAAAAVTAPSEPVSPGHTDAVQARPVEPAQGATRRTREAERRREIRDNRRRRRALFAVVPAIVLVAATALGISLYRRGSSAASAVEGTPSAGTAPIVADSPRGRVPSGPTTRDSANLTGVASARNKSGTTARSPRNPTSAHPGPAASTSDAVARQRTAARDTVATRAGAARVDSTGRPEPARRAIRPRRRPEPPTTVVPGWLPQGRPSFAPTDTAARKPDSTRAPRDTTRAPA